MKRFFHYIYSRYAAISFWLLIPTITVINFSHHPWVKPENVISWDVKSYYAYLPATFIYKDLSLEFMKEYDGKFSNWIWPVKTPIGKNCIVTSMGMSILYLPFFLIGHLVALITPYEADGYTVPYAFAIFFSAIFYLLIGLYFLWKFLRFYFDAITTYITLGIVFFGTNLLYYTCWGACLPHCSNFALISIFLYYNYVWHQKPTLKKTISLGLLSGLIVLIRPTNIIILLILFLWNVHSWNSFLEKIVWLLQRAKFIALMMLCFLMVWAPQLIYWKFVSGKFFFFSYGELGAKFFWDNPQFINLLFSFRKGWFVYTPIMLITFLGITLLFRKLKNLTLPVVLFIGINMYIQASWWCWWFGGSFSQRSFVDSYGIMAIPLAALIQQLLSFRYKSIPAFMILAFLTWYNTFQIKQFNRQAVHYWWGSSSAYCEVFMKKKPTIRYWKLIPIPDYAKARKGIYVATYLIERYKGPYPVTPQMIAHQIKRELNENDLGYGLKKRGEENGITIDSLLTIKAWNIYERKHNLEKYFRPIEDSLKALHAEPSEAKQKQKNIIK